MPRGLLNNKKNQTVSFMFRFHFSALTHSLVTQSYVYT